MDTQFRLQTTGIVLYFTSMWIAGITQGMMWRAYDEYGSLLYSFIDTVTVLHPYYTLRGIGGLFYLIGFFMFAYNMYKTATCGRKLSKEPINTSPMGA
jgi:cytochrome c oxidase cbb3-type subunit 1